MTKSSKKEEVVEAETISSISEIEVYIENLDERNPLPEYKSELASGMDLYASIPRNLRDDYDVKTDVIVVAPGQCKIIDTGIKVSIPEGYEIQIRSRSGLAAKSQVFVLNSPGTIDYGYLDEIKVILYNMGNKPFSIRQGDRIAQAVLQHVPRINWTQVDKIEDVALYDREGGLGSTGV